MPNKKEIQYTCTYWGCEHLSAKAFLINVVKSGFSGVEINLPEDANFIAEFIQELAKIRNTTNPNFIFIAQQVLENKKETHAQYIERISNRIEFLMSLKPDAINSHTGKDYYSFEENCVIIKTIETTAKHYNIPIWHEIHRGRFSFHLRTLLNYLKQFQNLKLIADFSHFCVVSESNLKDQKEFLVQVYPHVQHIHARVGFEQSPQVNNPFAPEWKNYLDEYVNWWKEIIEIHQHHNNFPISITPEFGPFPYMPQEPFSKKPLSNQWEVNLAMKNYLQQNL